ncbi:hypothetical protein CDD83_4485 [Cordyceps sp. RAO-2017]|nr:hypothetical protein CDD83_4485 [Cordyceps sp. RAO-2017]
MLLVGALTLLLPATARALVLPPPPSPYVIQWRSRELVDESRRDAFNSSHPRRLMVSIFSPVPALSCSRVCHVPYMPPAIASVEDAVLDAYLGATSWPKSLLASLEMELCCQTRESHTVTTQAFPTLFLGTGLNTTRLLYSATAQHLASAGYQVIVMDHPYETDVVQFPDGGLVFGGRVGRNPNDTAAIVHGLDVRTRDLSFVLDALRVPAAVYIGQSFGGAAAAAAATSSSERRILGGVNLDGQLWGPVVRAGVCRPFLTIGAEGHTPASIPSWGAFFGAMDEKHPGVSAKLLNVQGTVHGSFLDFSLIGDVAGLRARDGLEAFIGKATGLRVMEILKAYSAAFADYILRGADSVLLRGPSPSFPEVSFIR